MSVSELPTISHNGCKPVFVKDTSLVIICSVTWTVAPLDGVIWFYHDIVSSCLHGLIHGRWYLLLSEAHCIIPPSTINNTCTKICHPVLLHNYR